MKTLYQGNGFAVLEIDGQLKISWAEGMIGKPVFYDITEENFERLKRSEKDVKDVLFFCKNGEWPLSEDEELENTKNFIRKHPVLLLTVPENQRYFDKEELESLLKKAKEKRMEN